MFAENPENYQGKYPPHIYGYLEEADGQCFEDDFYDGVEEFIEAVSNIARAEGRLATGDSIEFFDDVCDEYRLGIQDIHSGVLLHDFDAGAVIFSKDNRHIFQYITHSENGNNTQIVQFYLDYPSIDRSILSVQDLDSIPKVECSMLIAKQCQDYIAGSDYQILDDGSMRMIDCWEDNLEIKFGPDEQSDFRSFALFTLGEIHCELLDQYSDQA